MPPDPRRFALALLLTASACDQGGVTLPGSPSPDTDAGPSNGASDASLAASDAASSGHDASIGTSPDASALDASTPDAPPDANPALAAKQKVLAYLAGISGKQTVVGIEDKTSSTPTSDSDTIAGITGKTPGFWSTDWGFGSDAVNNRQTIVDEGKRQWAKGAIVQYIYHACPLTMDELCSWDDIGGAAPKHLTDPQWTDLVTPGTALNAAWLARLDGIAPYFQQLKDAGVAPLFRVLHEMNQGVFWWAGRSGPGGTAKLFQITHDYLVGTKGLDNIIWVWNLQDFDTLHADVTGYAPGPSYFDVAALDVYNTGYTQGNYDDMKSASAGKPIGIAECQFMPTADLLTQQPLWTYADMWPDFISQNTSMLPGLYAAPNVLTLGRMPGWK
ncbi:MAG TPA: glycosyl hydrolase [Polyangiaceae bacterium]